MEKSHYFYSSFFFRHECTKALGDYRKPYRISQCAKPGPIPASGVSEAVIVRVHSETLSRESIIHGQHK